MLKVGLICGFVGAVLIVVEAVPPSCEYCIFEAVHGFLVLFLSYFFELTPIFICCILGGFEQGTNMMRNKTNKDMFVVH